MDPTASAMTADRQTAGANALAVDAAHRVGPDLGACCGTGAPRCACTCRPPRDMNMFEHPRAMGRRSVSGHMSRAAGTRRGLRAPHTGFDLLLLVPERHQGCQHSCRAGTHNRAGVPFALYPITFDDGWIYISAGRQVSEPPPSAPTSGASIRPARHSSERHRSGAGAARCIARSRPPTRHSAPGPRSPWAMSAVPVQLADSWRRCLLPSKRISGCSFTPGSTGGSS